MAEAKQSYAQRMKAARAAARVKREAEKAAWLRQIELHAEVRRLSLEAVKAGIVARGDRITLYTTLTRSFAPRRTRWSGLVRPAKGYCSLPHFSSAA